MYLTLYNAASCAAWGAILAATLADTLPGGYYSTHSYLGFPHKLVVAVQAANAACELAHAATGLVPLPIPTLLLQFFARLVITLGVSYAVPQLPGNYSYAYAVLSVAWLLTELVRYAFYLAKQLGSVPRWLLWLRYLAFIVFYPMGLLSEPVVVYQTLDHVTGYYHAFLAFGMVLYVPGFVFLYAYMWVQRRKYLGRKSD